MTISPLDDEHSATLYQRRQKCGHASAMEIQGCTTKCASSKLLRQKKYWVDGSTKWGLPRDCFLDSLADKLPTYPDRSAHEETGRLVEQLRTFCREQIDPVAIDRRAEIPKRVVDGLGQLGILARAYRKRAAALTFRKRLIVSCLKC